MSYKIQRPTDNQLKKQIRFSEVISILYIFTGLALIFLLYINIIFGFLGLALMFLGATSFVIMKIDLARLDIRRDKKRMS